jgi:high-affinity iron transporter
MNMVNALFVVWRECFEAVLIVGILYSYLRRQPSPARSMRFMWAGVAAGAALSALLAWGVQTAETELQGEALEWFEAGMLAVAAGLMAHMCVWMHHHARKLKGELESGLSQALTTAKLVGVATLAALAIAREGFELVMFFYGMGIEAASKGATGSLLAWSGAGVAATALTAWAFYRGLKAFNPRMFFRVTGIFLLITAGSLLLGAARKLIQMGQLPTLHDQVWDTSWLLDERGAVGRIVNSLTGYESSPSLMLVLIFAGYWAVTLFFYFEVPARRRRGRQPAELAPNRA